MAILDKYEDWTVLDKELVKKKGKLYLKCRCICGKEREVYIWSLQTGDSKRCSSCAGKLIKLSEGFKRSWKGNAIGDLSGTMYSHIKNKATERNMEFLVSKQFLWDLLCKQNHKCVLTGLSINLSTKVKNNCPDFQYITASLDRIDSSKPYTKDNVQWVHKDINRLKMNFDEDKFIEMCTLVANHRGKGGVCGS